MTQEKGFNTNPILPMLIRMVEDNTLSRDKKHPLRMYPQLAYYYRNRAKILGYHKRRMRFKGKRVTVEKPKIGKCQNLFCVSLSKETDRHHKKYHDNDPLLDTIEICNSCHGKISNRLRQIASEGLE